MKQKGAPKTSSKHRKRWPVRGEPGETFGAARREALLVGLVNLRNEDCERFWRDWKMFRREPNKALLKLRDELQKVWEPEIRADAGAPGWLKLPEKAGEKPKRLDPHDPDAVRWSALAEKQDILDSWLAWRPPDADDSYRPWQAIIGLASPQPDWRNLRAVLALLVLYQRRWMSKCHSPDCPALYFFARRRDQKYCGTDCMEYAKRQYALKHYHAKGAKRRKERLQREKSRKRRNKR